ncbi:PP2C-like domain-containing protein CG9801 isoform X2 [Orussus abietinus]|uniref:PP2C-like domain-containing protein CG9801 isoform X2 n=1 Tax=Orussus abietinus TaxID=222816 RepID=UPI000625EBB6|nr:PP2C-like domain-containing protein CG9801 isoform X2 [Orussus abietinus]
MPSLRKRVVGFMRQLSISNLAAAVENIGQGEPSTPCPKSPPPDFLGNCFITHYLNGSETKIDGPVILHGRNPEELPSKPVRSLDEDDEVFAAFTGPGRGLTTVNLRQRHLSISDPDVDYIDILESNDHHKAGMPSAGDVAGISNWFDPHDMAYGISTTLYEKNPTTNAINGEPIADCFGVAARADAGILAVADGVNWGPKASIAARSAVHGSLEYLNKALFSAAPGNGATTTRDVFVALLRSFHAAHSLILQEQGMLTTLTVCAVLPLADSSPDRYVACTCNVGDSLAYVYSRKTGVREITRGSHDIHCMRDMRDALGALGPVDGCNPELNNLTLAMTEVEEGDVVFLTTDGISDNFDPVVGKFAVLPAGDASDVSAGSQSRTKTRKAAESLRRSNSSGCGGSTGCTELPVVEAYQRHELTLLRMEDLLRRGVSGEGPPCDSAKKLCELLLDFAVRITAAKRRILEDTDLYYWRYEDGDIVQLPVLEQRRRRKKMLEKMSMVPGKLDHATVVAYVVGSTASSKGKV